MLGYLGLKHFNPIIAYNYWLEGSNNQLQDPWDTLEDRRLYFDFKEKLSCRYIKAEYLCSQAALGFVPGNLAHLWFLYRWWCLLVINILFNMMTKLMKVMICWAWLIFYGRTNTLVWNTYYLYRVIFL